MRAAEENERDTAESQCRHQNGKPNFWSARLHVGRAHLQQADATAVAVPQRADPSIAGREMHVLESNVNNYT